jgi:hypothetical protein
MVLRNRVMKKWRELNGRLWIAVTNQQGEIASTLLPRAS